MYFKKRVIFESHEPCHTTTQTSPAGILNLLSWVNTQRSLSLVKARTFIIKSIALWFSSLYTVQFSVAFPETHNTEICVRNIPKDNTIFWKPIVIYETGGTLDPLLCNAHRYYYPFVGASCHTCLRVGMEKKMESLKMKNLPPLI